MSTPVSMTATTRRHPLGDLVGVHHQLRAEVCVLQMREELVAPSPATWSSVFGRGSAIEGCI